MALPDDLPRFSDTTQRVMIDLHRASVAACACTTRSEDLFALLNLYRSVAETAVAALMQLERESC